MKRCILIALAVLLVAGFSFAAGKSESASSPKAGGWKQFAGQDVRVLGFNITYIAGLEPLLSKFKEKTGVNVTFDLFNEEVAYQKLRPELASGSGAYDVVWVQANNSIPFAEAKWLEPLEPLIENKSITFPETLAMDDIMPSLLNLMRYKDRLYGLPFFAATIITYYRSDVLKSQGIDPAQLDTIDGLVAAVKKIHSSQMAGIALRGHPGESSWISSLFLQGLGGNYLRDVAKGDYMPTLDSKAAIDSTRLYAELISKYSIPGGVNAKFDQVVIAMQQGATAIAIEGAPLAGRILDPAQSKVLGKVGFRMVPQGPGGRFPAFTGHGFGIPSASKNKSAAWLFLQWSNSKEITKEVSLTSPHVAVHRNSLWTDPDFVKKWNLAGEGDFLKTFQQSLQLGNPDYRPRIPGWPEVNALYGNALNKVMMGEDAATVMKNVQAESTAAMKRLGYLK